MAASVPEQVPINEYTATGLTDNFAYQFQVVQASDLKIYLDGVLQTTGFTISGIGNQNGGSVVFTSTNPVGVLRLERDIPLKRETDYQKHGDFREVVVDADFNRIWQKLQDIAAKLIGLVRVHYSETINEIPRLADRVNKALGFDAQGNFVAIPSDLPALVGMLEQAEEAKDAAQAAAAQAENRVPWTGPNGVAILPACKVADLVIANLPATGLLVTQDTDSGFPMWFDRSAALWKRLDPAKVATDLAIANAKIQALESKAPVILPLISLSGANAVNVNPIQAGINKVTILFDDVSSTSVETKRIRLGSSGILATTGYITQSGYSTTAVASTTNTGGAYLIDQQSGTRVFGTVTLLRKPGTNTWIINSNLTKQGGSQPGMIYVGGKVDLSGELDIIQIANDGSSTFDSGSLLITLEK